MLLLYVEAKVISHHKYKFKIPVIQNKLFIPNKLYIETIVCNTSVALPFFICIKLLFGEQNIRKTICHTFHIYMINISIDCFV